MKNKEKKNNRIKKRSIVLLIFIVVLTISAFYLINGTELLIPKIDEATASYISFNNSNSTDMLKINNIKRMKHNIGKSFLNTYKETFNVSGTKNENFNIELYSIGNKIDKKYINYVLLKNNKIIEIGNLENKEETNNGGIILYQGKIINDNSYEIKMWIDEDYKEKTQNVSYEIKINSR
ncbi:MAG: hypothetical protein IJ463_03115 [Bacilli bacterium]|nr:hypothetical protein [Bacilli bacterium]